MGAFSHITYAAKSDIGRKRKNNEDSFGVFPSMGVFCVADGMGGGDDGEVASAATVRAIETFVTEHPMPAKAAYSSDSLVAGVRAAVNAASRWIFDRAKKNHLKGCGSTFVGICFDASRPETAMALHAGDSRLYRIRGRSIQQITKDHSAAELIGAKNENEINPMFRGMILRAVGIQPTVEVDATPLTLQEGDRILICSDGLSKMVSDKNLLSIVREQTNLDKAVEALIAAANDAGGVDNITVELVEVGPLPAPLPVLEMSPEEAVSRQETRDSAETDTRDTSSGSTAASSFTSTMGTLSSTSGGLSSREHTSGVTMGVAETDSEEPEGQPAPDSETPSDLSEAGVRRAIVRYLVAILVVAVFAVGFLVYNNVRRKAATERARQEQVARAAAEKAKAEADRKAKEEAAAKAKAETERKAAEAAAAKMKAEAARKAKELAEAKAAAEKAKAEAARKAKELAEAKAAAEKAKAEAARKEKERAEEEQRRREKEENARLDALQKEQEAREAAQKAERQRLLEAQKAADAARRAEEQRKMEDERRQEAEAIKKAEARAKAEQVRQEAAKGTLSGKDILVRFEQVCEVQFAEPFVRNVKSSGRIERKKLERFSELFGALRKGSKKSEAERLKIACDLTELVQSVARSMLEYANLFLEDLARDQTDLTLSQQKRKRCGDRIEQIGRFLALEKDFVSGRPNDPKIQALCVELIRSKFQWISESP